MPVQIWYHGNCPDGFGAAWAARKLLADDAKYVPVLYGQPLPPTTETDTVLVFDISWPRAEVEALRSRVRRLAIVDHHKTAVNELAGLTYCHVDTNHSGAYLAWRYFFGDEKVPLLLQYVEDRDLWKFELLFSKEFSANLQSYPRNFDTWDDIGALVSSAGGLSSFTEAGRAILRSNDQHVERMVARAVKKPIGGYEVPVVNASILYSEVGEALWKKFDAPFAAYYFDRGDGKQQWGLRGRPGFDVSEVAKQFGGGGHAEAAGFVIDTFQPLVIK